MTKHLLLLLIILISVNSFSQIVINEIQSRNRDCLLDKDNTFPDWIELYNSGTADVNLQGYYLSDDVTNITKWQFPNAIVKAKSFLIVYTSGKGTSTIVEKPVNHWETAVFATDTWKYAIGSATIGSTWNTIAFNDAAWLSGKGGIGYADADDNTVVPTGTVSIYMRKTFTIADTSKISSAIFSMDYDDGFIAYLNGVEIARKNMITNAYNEYASLDHEATMYSGGLPENFTINYSKLKTIIQNGNNVLCVQTHNSNPTSSDLSSIPFLTFGLIDNGTYYSPTPLWFAAPTNNVTQVHTNFKLDSEGETLILSSSTGININSVVVPNLLPDHSYNRKPDGANIWCFSDTASPGKTNVNSKCYVGYSAMPVISPASGFYATKPTITITANAGDTIRYTLNGDIPTRKSPIYKGPITFDTTHVVRAKAFNAISYMPSEIATSTYVIANNTDLPIVSICTDSSNLWDWETGIYQTGPNFTPGQPGYGANYWNDWERECHMEYYDKNKVQQLKMNGLIKIHGGWTRYFAKKGMALKVEKYLPHSSLNYKFYDDKNITDYRSIVVRAQGQDNNEAHFRDAFSNQSLKNTNCDFIAFSPCVLYLNGAYWGIYELRELTNETYPENNYGVNRDSVDLIRGDDIVEQGSTTELDKTYNYINSNSMAIESNFAVANTLIDLDNMADWFIAETYYANEDWVGEWIGNIKLWREQKPTGIWRYLYYDMDMGLGFHHAYSFNKLSEGLNPPVSSIHSAMYRKLLQNTNYKNYFINRYADLMNTVFLPDSLNKLVDRFYNLYKNEMPRDWAKWFSKSINNWDYYINVVRTFINQRPTYARTHIQNQFVLSGQTTVNLAVATDQLAGRIKISTIYPKTYPWSGIYFKGIPVTLTAIENSGYTFTSWTINDGIKTTTQTTKTITLTFTTNAITVTANFNGLQNPVSLTVTEVSYHADSTHDAGDWFEIHNIGTSSINISDWFVKDSIQFNKFKFPMGTTILANGYLVVCQDTVKFKKVYPLVNNYIGNISFSLSNNAESIHLYNKDFEKVLDLNYNDSIAWLKCADGNGRTMELHDENANINNPNSWIAGCMFGSPGSAYANCSNQGVVFSEINYRSLLSFETGDWVELFNTTNQQVDLSGWVFKDDDNSHSYTIPANTVIQGKSYLVIYSNQLLFATRFPNVTNKVGPFAFGLSANNDVLRLFDNKGMLQFSVNYYDTAPYPLTADGMGYTLDLKDTLGIMCDGANWIANCLNGSPGTYCILTDITESTSDDLIHIYPVPAVNTIHLQLPTVNETTTATIFSVVGEQVAFFEIPLNTINYDFSIDGLSRGIYYIQLRNAVTFEQNTLKFIKQ